MKASLRSVRISPKKAGVIAKMVRGLSVADADALLSRVHKKGARLLQDLLKSAAANAKNNDGQDPSQLFVKTLIVNKAQAFHRGIPMSRGRMRRIRKFLSHIDMTLGVQMEESKETKEKPKSTKKASTTAKTPVKKTTAKSDSAKGSSKTKTTATPKASAAPKSSKSSTSKS